MSKNSYNSTRELCRLGTNAFLTQIMAGLLYSVSIIGYLPSLHRFVTNPTLDSLNGTNTSVSEVEAGLGQSELFYSFIIAFIYVGSVFGGFLSAFLIKYVPYWYLLLCFIMAHILGFTLYGIASQGWMMIVAMACVGLFTGGEVTLVFNYATDISPKFVQALRDRGRTFECDRKKAIQIRNYLYATHSFGYSIGFIIGSGVGVLFSHLPIEQYRSIAWFNVACGVMVLLLFVVFFRGESSWKDVCSFKTVCQCQCMLCPHKTDKSTDMGLGGLQIFIIGSLLSLSFVEMIKWAYLDALLNPVLSDSFGFSLGVSSYIYLALSLPRILGSILMFVLEKLKLSTQTVMIIGILVSISGYLLVTDWQTIPYDPCTEYSPFHHPDNFHLSNSSNDMSSVLNKHWITENQPVSIHSNFIGDGTLLLNPDVLITIGSRNMVLEKKYSTHPLHLTCQKSVNCSICGTQTSNQLEPCLTLINFKDSSKLFHHSRSSVIPNRLLEVYSCSVEDRKLCLNIYYKSDPNSDTLSLDAEIQQLMVLPNDVYDRASNSCENALNGECHWIPFSAITGEKCIDCPPICRGQHQTLLFPLFILGMAVLIFSNPLMWVPTIALANNQTPKSLQAIVIGSINSVNAIGQSVAPIVVDTLYEEAQKRTFSSSIPLVILHTPFLIGVIVLYQKLGPRNIKNQEGELTKRPGDK